LDAAVDSEADSTEVGAASEVVVVVLAVAAASIAAVVDVSATVATAHLMEHLQVLVAADLVVAATEAVDSMIVAHAATLTLSLYLPEEVTVEVIAAEIVVATVTAIATVIPLVGMLDKSDLTTVVGMTTQDRGAAIKWPSSDT
jgi:hypothetical protein